VFTPFSKAWHQHGRPAPAARPRRIQWLRGEVRSDPLPDVPRMEAGEAAALKRWEAFLHDGLTAYDEERDRPDLDTTSRLSAPLKYGEIHPRTILADIAAHSAGRSKAASAYVTELIWREFYADVLWHNPRSAWHDLRPELARLPYDSGAETDRLVDAWREGRTGYPVVDAGMRQLLEEGWMHNRVRMITASFLTKDLHVWWPVGAHHFLDHLIDGDIASNNHGWQWVAGTGTDASPYFRVFNPVTQGRRFDPDGDYVRRWVPELRHLAGAAAHEPWKHDNGYDDDYPERIVDHDDERKETLARYERARG
jgi:deoxyribodipyrimidine photo-lyase